MPLLIDLDPLDRRILAILRSNGRISNLDLAQAVGLAPSADDLKPLQL